MENNNSRHSNTEKKVSARQKALDLLLLQIRTEKELRGKLKERGYVDEEVDDAIDYAKSFGYINDATFASVYVNSRYKKKGKAVLRRELSEKGVAEEIIDQTLAQIPEETGDIVMEILLKKAKTPHRLEEKEKRSLYAFLIRRGFSSSEALRALREYSEKAEEEAQN